MISLVDKDLILSILIVSFDNPSKLHYTKVRFTYIHTMNTTFEVTSLSSKGQIVIPSAMRKELGMKAGTKLMICSYGEDILLKKIQEPKKDDFRELIKKSRAWAKSRGWKQSDVKKIIKQVRDENRSR